MWKQAVRIPLSPSKLPRVVWSGSALPSWELRRRQWHRVSRREFRTALDLVLGAVSFPVFTSVPPECTNAFLVARWSALLPVGDSVLLRQGSERISSKEDKTNKRGLGRQTFKPTVSQLMVNRTRHKEGPPRKVSSKERCQGTFARGESWLEHLLWVSYRVVYLAYKYTFIPIISTLSLNQ